MKPFEQCVCLISEQKKKRDDMEKSRQIQLVKKAKKGDDQAFITLCEDYQQVIYNAAYKLLLNHADASDCLQEAELKDWQNIRSLKNEAAFNSWLFRIMANIAKSMLTKKQKYVELKDYHLVSQQQETTVSDDIQDSVAKLPDVYRKILVLYYYAGFSIKQISEQERKPINTVKTRLARGRKMLKELLEDKKYG